MSGRNPATRHNPAGHRNVRPLGAVPYPDPPNFAMKKSLSILVVSVVVACTSVIPRNEYGLEVISTEVLYRRTVAADPSKTLVDLGSLPGVVLDVTLVGRDGGEVTMPTPYDEFTSRARHDFNELPEEAKRNRALLRGVMERHGFEALQSEWWHYDFRGWERFEILDLPM